MVILSLGFFFNNFTYIPDFLAYMQHTTHNLKCWFTLYNNRQVKQLSKILLFLQINYLPDYNIDTSEN